MIWGTEANLEKGPETFWVYGLGPGCVGPGHPLPLTFRPCPSCGQILETEVFSVSLWGDPCPPPCPKC
jgi:hypothetical protein